MIQDKIRIAAFYDAENISAYAVPKIFRFLQTLGTVIEQEAHGDYSMPLMEPWNEFVLKNVPVRMIHKPHNGQKEVADKSIMSEIASYPIDHPDTAIAIVTSDNDFVETSSVLVRRGIRVIGIGTRKQSRPGWISSCSEFYFIEDIKYENEDEIDDSDLEDEASAASALAAENDRKKPLKASKGTVFKMRQDLGCGFISAAGGKSYYFSISDALNDDGTLAVLPEGACVTFSIAREYNPEAGSKRWQNGLAVGVKLDSDAETKARSVQGTVYKVLEDKEIGFIRTKGFGGKKEYFFSMEDVADYDKNSSPVCVGDKVKFKIAKPYDPTKRAPRDRTGVAKKIEVIEETQKLL